MKRFWVFVIICVVALGLGFTVFRFMTREEVLYINQAVYQVNSGENFTLDIVKQNLKASTEVYIEVENESITKRTSDVDSYNFKALSGGSTRIIVRSNMAGFTDKIINVTVGDGNSATPFFIKNQEQLKEIGVATAVENGETVRYPLSSSYTLLSNISLTGDWTPIGSNTEEGFTGNFDFNDKSISNLAVNSSASVNAGLFAKLGTTAVIKNAKVYSATISGNAKNMGVLAGQNLGSIENAVIDGARITNTVSDACVGALVGLNNGTITKAQAFNSILSATGTNSVAGGLVGASVIASLETSASIARSSAECDVKGSKAVGGLVGYISGSTIENCYAGNLNKACVITSGPDTYAGGIVGISEFVELQKEIKDNNNTIEIKNIQVKSAVADTYSAMQFSNASSGNIGGIIGYNKNYTTGNANVIFGNYYSSDINAGITSGIKTQDNPVTDDIGVYSKTTEELKQQSVYYSFRDSKEVDQYWQFSEGVWTIDTGRDLPKLSFDIDYVSSRIKNFAAPDAVYNSNFVSKLSNADAITEYVLKEDIYLRSSQGYKPFDFNGILKNDTDNGNTWKIYLEITGDQGVVDGAAAVFKTLGPNAKLVDIVVDVRIENITGNHVAAVAAYNNGILENCSASNSITTDYADNTLYLAGLIAENKGKISNCTSNVNLIYTRAPRVTYVGGIAAYSTNSILNSTNKGLIVVTGNASEIGYVGGIVGYANAEVNTCANKGTITGEVSASRMNYAGIVGMLYSYSDAVIKYCANYSSISGSNVGGIVGISLGSVENCYVAGSISLTGKYVGGLAYNIKYGHMTNCMTDGTNIDASSVGCGAVYAIDVTTNHTAYCEFIFSSCYFSGSGAKYYESSSNIRGDSSNFFKLVSAVDHNAFNHSIHVFRSSDITRSYYDNNNWIYANAGNASGELDIQISDEEAKGSRGYSIFVQNSYSSTIWNYGDETVNNYIQLKNIAK